MRGCVRMWILRTDMFEDKWTLGNIDFDEKLRI